MTSDTQNKAVTFISKTFQEFTKNQKSLGILLILCTVISLSISNSFLSESYLEFWHHEIGIAISSFKLEMSIGHFINDALMAVFFLLVGLEIKRELYKGELSSFSKASLPLAAALGGMVVPILFYALFNFGKETSHGWGVPMATDIAFAIGILSLAGNRVPISLKILLTALAVVDDLGAVIVIAIFYTSDISILYLSLVLVCMACLILLNRLRVLSLYPYLLLGILLWYFVYMSGIHATIAGVLLAFMIPLRGGEKKSLLTTLEHSLHVPVNFFIMPLFALANTAILLEGSLLDALSAPESLGIVFGLVLGKPIGIVIFMYIAIKAGISVFPDKTNFKQLLGLGFLGGIGFTMSIFIALLSFDSEAHIFNAKLAILFASLIAGISGYLLLKFSVNGKTG